MEPATSLSNFQRLHELMTELGMEGAAASLPGMLDSGVDERNVMIRSACDDILRELAARSLPAQPDAARKLGTLVPVLVGLEHLSLRDLAHVDACVERARDAARTVVHNLPVRLQAKCRTSVSGATVSAADLLALTTDQLLARLQRQLLAEVAVVVRGAAREIQQHVCGVLIEAIESLYPLGCAADDIMRATGHGVSHGADKFASVSLVARLSTARDHWRRAVDSLAAPDANAELNFDAGALTCALGAASTSASLNALSASQLGAASSPAAFKSSVLKAVQTSIWRHWELKGPHIQESVDQYVETAFAGVKRHIDEWFVEVQHRSSLLCGRPANAEGQSEAARLEVLDILRQAGGDASQQASA
jgi:hypothetical protein